MLMFMYSMYYVQYNTKIAAYALSLLLLHDFGRVQIVLTSPNWFVSDKN